MIKKILTPINPIELFLLLAGTFLGLAISHFLGFTSQWSGYWNGFLLILFIIFGFKYLGNYIKIQFLPYSREGGKNQEIGLISIMVAIAFFAISMIPAISLGIHHLINPINILFIALGILILCMVELLPSQTSKWGLEEFFRAFLYANIIPAFSFSLQIQIYHRLVFLLTFPLFFLYLSLFIVINISKVHGDANGSQGSLISRIGPFAVFRLHNLCILMGYLILLSGTFFELPWRLIWPALLTIPIGLIQIWQVNQILSGKKPNIPALEFTAASVALFSAYFSILALWLT